MFGTNKAKGRAADPLRELFESLDRRRRPEDVAQLVGDVLADRLSPKEERILKRASRGALAHFADWFSSMSDDFARPMGMERQCSVAAKLFTETPACPPEKCGDPAAVREYLTVAEREIAKEFGRNDFKYDRLNREAREAAGLDISKRQYNKRFRLAARMERKRLRLLRELKKRSYTLISKSRLASRLSWDEFRQDLDSACFIAYYTSRCNLRSEFTISGQQRPYDEIADMLFQRCRRNDSADWWSIAHAYPDQEVLRRLSDSQKGELLGRWYGILQSLAEFLHELWMANSFDAQTMIVRRGNDSTTWNTTAGAWNKARDSWFALLVALDMEDVIERLCPGKALRLMAADVAAWHRMTGNTLEVDTFVWQKLPFPWEVVSGLKECRRDYVEAVCREHGIDPVKKGWSAPRTGGKVQVFRPTPELVHGVTVGHPGLALVLKKLGYFSGKSIKLAQDYGDGTSPMLESHPE
jgi:hypothetical protein